MTCKGKKQGDWCSDMPIHYTDASGDGYCLFHTPRGFKGEVTAEEFSRQIFERIKRYSKEGNCNLSGTIFEWSIDFSPLTREIPLSNASLAQSIFYGAAGFRSTIFNGETDFTLATFYGTADFEDVIFNGPCDFHQALFIESPSFFDTLFQQLVDFSNATFQQGVLFTWGGFKGEGRFDGATYGARVIFKRAVA